LDGIEQRLHDTEREFDSARREAKTAKDRFNAVKQKRFVSYIYILEYNYMNIFSQRYFPFLTDANGSVRLMIISRKTLIKYIKI